MKLLKTILATISVIAVVFAGGSALYTQPAYAATSTKQEVCEAIGSSADCSGNKGGNLTNILSTIINVLSFMVGITAVIMIIVAGFKYITSGGDTSKVTSAKNALVYAIIGVVIVGLAQFMVHFVLRQTTKLTNTSVHTTATITLK